MIRHRPHGSEHPYLTTADQRVPARPLAGEQVGLGVLAAERVTEVSCEWQGPDGTVVLPLVRETGATSASHSQDAAVDATTHLAAAAAGQGRSRSSRWQVTAPALPQGGRARYRFRASDADGRTRTTRWYPVTAAAWSATGGTLHAAGRSRILPGSVEWLTDADGIRRVRFALPLAEGEHVVGFGERYDRLDQRGHALDAVVFEQYKGQGQAGRTYFPMPFAHVVGGDGWGFHIRTSRRTWYDVAASEAGLLWIETELGGTDDEELEVAFYDGSPRQVLDAFLDETGRPQELPAWIHRLWASGNEWNTQRAVAREMDRHRDEDVPVGVVVIEAWSDEATFTAFRDARYQVHEDGSPHRLSDFTFPADGAWPDPKAMVEELHARDIKVLLWQIPLMKLRPHPSGQARADADAMLRHGYGIREADGRPYRNRGWWFPLALMPDLTDPEARRWWLDKRRYLVEDLGIDGFKTDGGEHAWGHDLRYADGTRGDVCNNLFPVHYAAAYGELLASAGKAPVTFSRAGFTGGQAHGAHWAGDEDSTWEGLRSAVVAGLSAGACGVTHWGWDLGGFSGEIPDAELYIRATQFAVFAPIFQYHSEYNHHRTPSRDRTPWNIAERTGDPRALTVFRTYAHLRERLVPYLHAQSVAGLRRGEPLMRSAALFGDGSPQAWEQPDVFLLGDDLLVAPVTEPAAASRSAYLPAGEWVDVWTGERVTGGRAVVRPTPLEEIPVWCRVEAWPAMAEVFGPARPPRPEGADDPGEEAEQG